MNDKRQEKKRSYRNYQEEFLILLEEGLRSAGRVTKREFDRVNESVRQRLERKYGKEKVDQFSNRIKADWEDVVQKMNDMRARLEAEEAFRRGKQIGVQVLENLASAFKRAAENLEATLSDKVTYHAGQVVDKGAYVCIDCKKIQDVRRRKKLTICPECGSSEFRMA
jgi:hypothetical protein